MRVWAIRELGTQGRSTMVGPVAGQDDSLVVIGRGRADWATRHLLGWALARGAGGSGNIGIRSIATHGASEKRWP